MSTISNTKLADSLNRKFGFNHSWSRAQLVQNITNRIFKDVSNGKTTLLTKASLTSAVRYIKAHNTKSQNYGHVVDIVTKLHQQPVVKKSDIQDAVTKSVKKVPNGDKLSSNFFNDIIKHLSHVIAMNVKHGNKVRLNGLGTFRRSTIGPRKARVIPNSPLTHKPVKIPAQSAHHTIRFKGSSTLKNELK